MVNDKKGLPSFFMTGSCAEFYFPLLRRLLEQYILQTTGKEVNLAEDSNACYKAVQENTHVVFLEWNFIYNLNTYSTYITDVIITFTLTIYLLLILLIPTLLIQFFFLKCLKETIPQKFFIFFLNRLMLFDLKEIYFLI